MPHNQLMISWYEMWRTHHKTLPILRQDKQALSLVTKPTEAQGNFLTVRARRSGIRIPVKEKVKVKQSIYRPGVAQRVPES